MTVKQFFKGTAFKCLITLLCVLLISGIFLTIAYGFFEVTDEEKFNRKVGNLYSDGAQVTTENKEIEPAKVGNSTIEKLWLIPEKNDYLVQVSGTGRDGKIVTWVIVEMDSQRTSVTGIGTVLVYETVASEYAYKISGWNTNIENFSKDYKDGIVYKYGTAGDPMYINTGASTSFTAICNCVNDAISFMKAYASGGPIGGDPLDGFAYTSYIDSSATSFSVEDGIVVFNITTKKNGLVPNPYEITVKVNASGEIAEYTIVKSGAYPYEDKNYPELEYGNKFSEYLIGKKASDIIAILGTDSADLTYQDCRDSIKGFDDGELATGATQSNFVNLYAALFATSNYVNAAKTALKYTSYINTDSTKYVVGDDGSITYNIHTVQNGLVPNPYEITVKVNASGEIAEFAIVKSGAYPFEDKNYPELEYGNKFSEYLIGKKASDIIAILGTDSADLTYQDCRDSIKGFDDGELATGATQSNFVNLYAALFATSNFRTVSMIGGNVNE